MTLNQLRYAVTAAESGSVTEAAGKLFLSQPSLTSALHELEKELGITIFLRSGRGITTTTEGDEFLGYARQLLEQENMIREKYMGGYDGIARYLFSRENVNAYYLEYDSDRSGGFAPLKEITGDKKVVLGLITTKSPELEDKEKVIARIREAANYISLDRLYLSPQCGFASCEIGNKLTEEEQWAKLALVKEIAKEVWG